MGRVVVNGCFLAHDNRNARNARSLAVALGSRFDGPVHLALPDIGIVPAPPAMDAKVPGSWHSASGLAWEQTELPRMLDRDDVLVSLAGTGPPRRRQVLTIPDADPDDPFTSDPELSQFVETTQRGSALRAAAVATLSEERASALRRDLGIRNVHVIPAGIDAGFSTSERDLTTAAGFRPYALGVGAHEYTSRLDWLALRWRLLQHKSPLKLVLTTSSEGAATGPRLPAGVHVVVDPTDHHLAQLYANAEMLVFPGAFDAGDDPTGPLIRALASGTPFLATDSAAARAVAVRPEVQLIDLTRFGHETFASEDDAWVTAMYRWATTGPPVSREACRTKAAQYSWSAAAGHLVNLIRTVD